MASEAPLDGCVDQPSYGHEHGCADPHPGHGRPGALTRQVGEDNHREHQHRRERHGGLERSELVHERAVKVAAIHRAQAQKNDDHRHEKRICSVPTLIVHREYLLADPPRRFRRLSLREANPLNKRLGSRKTWIRLRSKGFDVSRCSVERVMQDGGWRGANKHKSPKTTIANRQPNVRRIGWVARLPLPLPIGHDPKPSEFSATLTTLGYG